MLFKISRTSMWDEGKPCEGAIRRDILRRDEHPISDPKYFRQERDRKEWYLSGINHRVENGHIVRDFLEPQWMIEISSLEELVEFAKKESPIIVSSEGLEIYDDYREDG